MPERLLYHPDKATLFGAANKMEQAAQLLMSCRARPAYLRRVAERLAKDAASVRQQHLTEQDQGH